MTRRILGVCLVASVLAACGGTVRPNDGSGDGVDGAASDAVNETVDAAPDVPFVASIGRTCVGGTGFQPVMGDCETGELCLTDNFGFTNGYCVQDCSANPCPMLSTCVNVGGRYPLCLATCTMNSDCRVDEGYSCQVGEAGGPMVCLPISDPVGTRNGAPCYTTTAGAHQLPALARTHFAANLAASETRTDSSAEAEGNVVVSPTNGTAVVSYIATTRSSVFMGTTSTPDGATVRATGTARHPTLAASSDPVLAYTADGRLHMVFLAYNFGAMGQPTGMRLAMADSTDDGQTWANVREIEPATTCANGCDKPWIVVGPSPGGTGESVYVGFMVQGRADNRLVVLRSTDATATWSTPVTFATGPENIGGAFIVPNLLTFALATDGALHVTYAGLNYQSAAARFGDPGNRIGHRVSTDGGATWSPVHRVSRAADSPVYNQPMIAVDGTTIYVAFTNGPNTGAWDTLLATSTDQGATWTVRKVNDEPDSCATHSFPALVADTTRHVAHVTWYENRFGGGAVAYASCPQNPAQACGTNEQVSDAPFTFTTARDPSVWHGDYMGLSLDRTNQLWAGWSDTRLSAPHMYMAHSTLP